MPLKRVAFATIAVSGLGVFVALAVGITLWLSGAAGVRSTQTLLAEQAESLVDDVERRLDLLLGPVNGQADWIHAAFADGRAATTDPARLDAFMLGALGGATQVATLALLETDGTARRWSRARGTLPAEDWSARPTIVNTIARGQSQRGFEWRPPLWGQGSGAPVLLHVSPLRRGGVYLGVLVQVVPVARLSEDLANFARESGVTPFVLLGGDRVLAHPSLVGEAPQPRDPENPLPRVSDFPDPVLVALLGPKTDRPIALRNLTRANAVSVQVGGERYIALSRPIDRYGAEPWTVGAYASAERGGQASEMRRLLVSLGAGAGAGVLLLAVLFAAWAGRRLSRPVQALAAAARAVQEGELEAVPPLAGSRIVEFDDASHSFNRMVERLRERRFAGQQALNRVGVSTGPVVAGAVGARGRLSYTVHGSAVNMASRLEALNKAYGTRILVSGETASRCTRARLRKVADAMVCGRRGTQPVYTPQEEVPESAAAAQTQAVDRVES